MKKGVPLTDEDRVPWLCALHQLCFRLSQLCVSTACLVLSHGSGCVMHEVKCTVLIHEVECVLCWYMGWGVCRIHT